MIDGELMDEIREASAQGKTSLHECELCNGYGRLIFGAFGLKKCPMCQGTGKEKAK